MDKDYVTSAFPVPDSHNANGQVQYGSNGMLLRDWFAGHIITSSLNGRETWMTEANAKLYAAEAYLIADAMMEARSK